MEPVTATTAPPTMTFEEFIGRADVPEHSEWVRGEVETVSPVSSDHSCLALYLGRLLACFCEETGCGEVRGEPYQVRLPATKTSRSPDVMLVLAEHADRLKDSHAEAPVDLVVEVISPESRGRDRGDKFYEYEQAGIAEYWLIDPERRVAEFYRLAESGYFETMPAVDGRLASAVVPGLWLEVDWLWTRPSTVTVLRAWGLLA